MSHFANLGFRCTSEDDFSHLVSLMIEHHQDEIDGTAFNYGIYRENSGLQMWLVANKDGNITSLEPYFVGGVHRLGVDGMQVDSTHGTGWVQAWINATTFDNGEWTDGECPLIIDVPNVATLGELGGQVVSMQLCAFGEDVQIYADEASYDTADTGDVAWATKSLAPIGMFTDGEQPATAHIQMSGIVKASHQLTNALTGLPYYHCQIETFCGVIDAVFSDEMFDSPPQTGNVITGIYWLTGQVI